MNIIFTIKVHNFDKAASVENHLKQLGITYCVRVDDKPSLGAGKHKAPRKVIGKDELLAVTTCIADHPDWTILDVSRATGVSRATVGRIKNGTHVLQTGGSDIEKDI